MPGIATGPTTHWVVVPPAVPFRNNRSFWVGDKLLRRKPHLAICQDRLKDRLKHTLVLLFCDKRWRPVGVTTAESLAEAKAIAERHYPGLMPHWVDAGITERQAERYMKQLRRDFGCSFCGLSPAEHGGSQIESRSARICSSCIQELHQNLNKGGTG
jgi:hypothetical protein